MNQTEIVKNTAEHVKNKFTNEASGHDWWHSYRVWQLAKRIAVNEPKADKFIVELGALLHDIADWKFNDDSVAPKEAKVWLKSQGANSEVIKQVQLIINNVSFKGAGTKPATGPIELLIVSDADKLDGSGAVGIARTFAYGGYIGNPIYDPQIKPKMHESFEQYKADHSHSINHFYEKLLLLKDRLQTKTGRQIAAHRHKFLESYLQEFLDEWDGKI